MEDIIKMIMSIDQKASDIIKQTKERVESKEAEIKKEIEDMRAQITDKTKRESKELYDSVIKEAEDNAKKVHDETESDCMDIENNFLKIKGKMESQLFTKVFG